MAPVTVETNKSEICWSSKSTYLLFLFKDTLDAYQDKMS